MPCLTHLILTTSVKINVPEEVSSDGFHIISLTYLCSYCPTSLQKEVIECSEFTDRFKAKKLKYLYLMSCFPGPRLRFLYSTSIQEVKIPNANKLVEVIKYSLNNAYYEDSDEPLTITNHFIV